MTKGSTIYQEYQKLYDELVIYQEHKIPLCAAETYVSDFVKSALSSEFEGKYCMGFLSYNKEEDFIGGEYIHRLFELVQKQCYKTFNAKYSDARTLSGMNCITLCINSLLKPGDNILLTTPEQGGHPSVPLILKLNQINYESIPYDYSKKCLDYDSLNELIRSKKYKALMFVQSDLIQPIDVTKININDEIIIYDATQTLGMIAAKVHDNPLKAHKNVVLIGGTHKTLPGPTCGLIMTNNDEYIAKLDQDISPNYLRNVQPNNIASVLLTLIENEAIGFKYQSKIIENANYLAKKLEDNGLKVGKISKNVYSKTHQIFVFTSQETMNTIYKNAIEYGITLNKKKKKLFDGGFGIRIGLQQVTRYGWTQSDLDLLAELIIEISKENADTNLIKVLISTLSPKKNNIFLIKV